MPGEYSNYSPVPSARYMEKLKQRKLEKQTRIAQRMEQFRRQRERIAREVVEDVQDVDFSE